MKKLTNLKNLELFFLGILLGVLLGLTMSLFLISLNPEKTEVLCVKMDCNYKFCSVNMTGIMITPEQIIEQREYNDNYFICINEEVK